MFLFVKAREKEAPGSCAESSLRLSLSWCLQHQGDCKLGQRGFSRTLLCPSPSNTRLVQTYCWSGQDRYLTGRGAQTSPTFDELSTIPEWLRRWGRLVLLCARLPCACRAHQQIKTRPQGKDVLSGLPKSGSA